MINKLDYEFSIIKDGFSWEYRPYISLRTFPDDLPPTCIVELEVNQIHFDDLWSIVKKIEEVKNKERESFHFGLTYYWENYPESQVSIDYNYGEGELETSLTIDDILKMMTDYRNFVDTWEKETGKVKK